MDIPPMVIGPLANHEISRLGRVRTGRQMVTGQGNQHLQAGLTTQYGTMGKNISGADLHEGKTWAVENGVITSGTGHASSVEAGKISRSRTLNGWLNPKTIPKSSSLIPKRISKDGRKR